MKISYFKRFKMEIELASIPPVPTLPAGFSFVPWADTLLEAHAEVKSQCFHDEIDAAVFPNLANRDGCFHLMQCIRQKSGFVPEATWLIAGEAGFCATVQGICERHRLGAIQNLGVIPSHRGHGLGRTLLLQSLHGFIRRGLGRGMLEVTAQNEGAIRLYRSVGFRCVKTVYKATETPETVHS
jgi:ribosomal protein S18 acetylase RimI-like enzyme